MNRRAARILAGSVGLVMASLGLATPAHASDAVIAKYEMNEPAGARVMNDSSQYGRDGAIGSDVRTGVALTGGAKGYRFPALPAGTGTRPQHVVQVPDTNALDPGTADYRVVLRFRTSAADGNLVQKGQSGAAGGFFVVQVQSHVATCLFRGAAGSVSVRSAKPVDDGALHNLTCYRIGNEVMLVVDATTARGTGPTGAITNDNPVAIGGKLNCNGTSIKCDYFVGDLDYLRLRH